MSSDQEICERYNLTEDQWQAIEDVDFLRGITSLSYYDGIEELDNLEGVEKSISCITDRCLSEAYSDDICALAERAVVINLRVTALVEKLVKVEVESAIENA